MSIESKNSQNDIPHFKLFSNSNINDSLKMCLFIKILNNLKTFDSTLHLDGPVFL